MKITELIDKLQRFEKDHGNLEVEVAVNRPVEGVIEARPMFVLYDDRDLALIASVRKEED